MPHLWSLSSWNLVEVIVSPSDTGRTKGAPAHLWPCCFVAMKNSSAHQRDVISPTAVRCSEVGCRLLLWRRVLKLLIEQRRELLLGTWALGSVRMYSCFDTLEKTINSSDAKRAVITYRSVHKYNHGLYINIIYKCMLYFGIVVPGTSTSTCFFF